MFTTLTKDEMINRLIADEYANWSYESAELIIDWIEELEEITGEPVEFDPVAIRCQWYIDSTDDFCDNYSVQPDEMLDYLADNTMHFHLDNGDILYEAF